MKPTDFINGTVTYDRDGQYLWINNQDGIQMLATLRGWGRIQNMFAVGDGKIDMDAAAKFQDEVGQFVADAINEKLNSAK